MENWLPALPSFIAIIALWWKVTSDMTNMRSQMATKTDIAELKADMREIRQMLFAHISGCSHSDSKQSNPE